MPAGKPQQDIVDLIREHGAKIRGLENKIGTMGPVETIISGTFNFSQSVPSATWVILHSLGYHPTVTIVTSSGVLVEGEVTYDNLNQVTVRFSSGFSGSAYLS